MQVKRNRWTFRDSIPIVLKNLSRSEQDMKKIALFGGSFNPPHEGHFEMARYIHKALGVDEVWFLFSLNHQKDPAQYAALEHRMEMGRIMARHYPDMPFIMSGIEDELGTHITHEVLTGLRDRFPDHRFIWTMGADNLAGFHTWEHFDSIIENFPIAVVDRPPYTEKAQHSPTILTYPHLKIADPKNLATANCGWCFLDNPQIDMSSSDLLLELRNGCKKFAGPFQDVADYILRNALYGTGVNIVRPAGQNELKREPV